MKKNIAILILTAGMLFVSSGYSQIKTLTNVSPNTTPLAAYVGWDGAGGVNPRDLEFANYFGNKNMFFYTHDGTSLQLRMSILSTGEVGIGNIAPIHKLDVDGDINIGYGNGFRITTGSAGSGSQYILWNKGNFSNIFVGIGAGVSCTGVLNTEGNTFVGHNAGTTNTNGIENTFIGAAAGSANVSGGANTFVGFSSGNQNTGIANTFVGHFAGTINSDLQGNTAMGESALFSQTSHMVTPSNTFRAFNVAIGSNSLALTNGGINNTAIGTYSGVANETGNENIFMGYYAGNHNSTGSNNTYLGVEAGGLVGTMTTPGYGNETGSGNTFVGYRAATVEPDLENAAAIGNTAEVKTSNNMILGNNDVNVGIGLSGIAGGALAKLHVARKYGLTAAITDPTGVIVENDDIDSDFEYYGYSHGLTVSTTGRNANNFGGTFKAEHSIYNTAGLFEANATFDFDLYENLFNIGVNTSAHNGDYNSGIQSSAKHGTFSEAGNFTAQYAVFNYGVNAYGGGSDFTQENYGVYARADAGANTIFNVAVMGSAAVNPSTPSTAYAGTWAGYFDGDLNYSGTLYTVSDSTIKKNIHKLENTELILSKLNSYSYYFDTTQLQKSINVAHNLQFGIMAQEVEKVAPNLVLNTIIPPVLDSLGKVITPSIPVKMVNYIGLIPLLVDGYNKQQAIIDTLINRLDSLIQSNSHTKNNGGLRSTGSNMRIENKLQLATELTDDNAIILDQNSPNPFAEQTKITWFIPENDVLNGSSLNAQLFFYNRTGNILKNVKIEQTGYGELIVYANNLSDGTYTYTLVVNGKTIDTKKMVKTK